MKGFRYTTKNMFFLRLHEDEDILLSLRKAVKEHGIQNAVILMGMGSVKCYHFHVVDSGVNPPLESFPKGQQAADIVNINGLVINGRVHAHITLSDSKVAFGGHLEEGCKVLTFNVTALAEVEDADFTDWDAIKKF
jgi:predicted DNA-binding protein with PD1-like motif